MTKFDKFLYLFFSQYKPVRAYIGGKWVRDKDPAWSWICFEHSILPEFIQFEDLRKNPRYETENYRE